MPALRYCGSEFDYARACLSIFDYLMNYSYGQYIGLSSSTCSVKVLPAIWEKMNNFVGLAVAPLKASQDTVLHHSLLIVVRFRECLRPVPIQHLLLVVDFCRPSRI